MKYYIYECQGSYGICRQDQVPNGAILTTTSADTPQELYDDLREMRSK